MVRIAAFGVTETQFNGVAEVFAEHTVERIDSVDSLALAVAENRFVGVLWLPSASALPPASRPPASTPDTTQDGTATAPALRPTARIRRLNALLPLVAIRFENAGELPGSGESPGVDGLPSGTGPSDADEFDDTIALPVDTRTRRRVVRLFQLFAEYQTKQLQLRTTHHRVKNNLQMILSLLNLQTMAIDDPGVGLLFRRTQNRVLAMSVAQDQLYRSGRVADIPIQPYLSAYVDQCLANLTGAGDTIVPQVEVTGCATDSPILAMNDTIAIGLITNELVANSLIHGFGTATTETGNEQISVGVRNHAESVAGFVFTYSDNGCGIIDRQTYDDCRNMGMQLVMTLAAQLAAEVETTTSPGDGVMVSITVAR